MARQIMEAGKMIAEGAGGAILGSFCESILKSIEQCCTYDNSLMESVKSSVENLMEVIPKMEDHNMKLGDRQDEVKELKEEMKRGARLLEEMTDVMELSCFKASYNSQLVELDASLKSLVSKLRLQSAVDVKEVLVLEKETAELVRSTKRKVDKVDESVTYIQRRQELMDMRFEIMEKMISMKKQKKDDSATQVEHVVESAALAASLAELDDAVRRLQRDQWLQICRAEGARLRYLIQQISAVVLLERAENEEMTYIPVAVLKHFRMSIEDGVTLLRKCTTNLESEWTEELKSEYANKFHALENTLEQLYNRLAGIRPLKWRCGKCDKSLAAVSASTSLVDSAGFCH